MRTGDLREQTEAHAIGTIGLHEHHGVDAIPATLRHGLAIGAHDRGMDDHIFEGDLIAAVFGCHDHAGDPKAHDVTCGREQLRRIVFLQVRRIHAIDTPPLRSEGPEL